MTEEENNKKVPDKESEEEEEDKEEETRREETEKAFSTVKSSIDTLTDVVQSLAETQKSVAETIGTIDGRLKALETPTDLKLNPKGNAAGDDVGADVKVPDTYQSNSRQVGLDSDRKEVDGAKKPQADQGKLSMQEKTSLVQKSEHTFSTETPRPNAALETVDKSTQDFSPILKDARSNGFDGLSQVARDILAGKYYKPSADEVGQW
tara:strand:+ start:2109 stop:2729 length:621 start_codon:yes stop_codon:yes gene_type:complete